MGPPISSRAELVAEIYRLLDEPRALEWENAPARAFLEAMATWLHEQPAPASGQEPGAAAWQLFAEALRAGRG